jgi:hypothetical protein
MVSNCPVRSSATSAAFSMPRHSVATMNSVLRCGPPSMQAKQPRSALTVCSTSPPSRTRTQRLLGTSAYQTAPSASMQMPSGTPLPRSAYTRRFDKVPSTAMSRAVSFLAWDSAMIKVELSGGYEPTTTTIQGKLRFVSTSPTSGEPSITEDRTRLAALQRRNVTVHCPVERYLPGAILDSLWSV